MYPRDYYDRFEEIGESYKDGKGLLHVELESITEETRCQHCGGTNIKRIGFRKKEGFMDVTGEGAPVEITFRLQRYLCHDCTAKRAAETNADAQKKIQTTFTAECLPDCIKKNRKISTDVVDAIIKKVAIERVSIAAAAEDLHVAASTISDIISKQRKAALEKVATVEAPDVLIVYPFDYGQKERSAILGVLGERPMLYAILDDCRPSTVRKYLTDTKFEGGFNPSTALTDYPRVKLHRDFAALYPNTSVGILREATFAKMREIRNQSWSRKMALEVDYALMELGKLLSVYFYDEDNDEFIPIDIANDDFYENLAYEEDVDVFELVMKSFRMKLSAWWAGLSETMRAELDELHNTIIGNRYKVVEGLMYSHAQYDPAVLLQCIHKCNKNHVPFKDLMSWLALAAGVHNKENITAPQMLSCSYVPKPIHGFYIDLNELNALLDS